MVQSPGKSDTSQRHSSFRSNHNRYLGDPPSIEIDHFDASPFSESFSGMLDEEAMGSPERSLGTTRDAETSFLIEQITDLKEIDPEWDDEEIEEILVLSPKMPNRLSTIMEDLHELDKKTNSIFTLVDFDFVSEDATGMCLVRKRDTQQTYNMKRFKTTSSHSWPPELSILEMINDREAPFLPKISWRVFEEGSFSLIMDSYPGGSVLEYVETNGPLPFLHALLYASEFVEALSVIHAAGIQHSNITPENLMIDARGHIVLVGFEHACVNDDTDNYYSKPSTNFLMPRPCEYRAPELLLGWTHDYAVDCWGFGCVLYYMMFGKHPFPVDLAGSTGWQEKIIHGHVPYDIDGQLRISLAARELIQGCLEPNPAFRLNISEIKGHIFFSCVNWSLVHEKNVEAPYIPCSDLFETRTTSAKHRASDNKTIRKAPSATSIMTSIVCPSEWDVQTPTPPYSATSPSMFSLKAREEVQDLLPTIFRISHEDTGSRSQLQTRSRTSTAQSVRSCSSQIPDNPEIDYCLSSPTPTYDSLRRRLDSTPLTQEERMARFWESLDQDIKMKSPDMTRCSTGELAYLPKHLPFGWKPRNQDALPKTDSASASRLSLVTFASSTQRLSQLVKPAPHSIASAILRKHKSSPSLVPIRTSRENLPRGIEQIGSGIGYTYQPPVYPIPLPVSPPVNEVMSRSKMKRQLSGLKVGTVWKWGSELWVKKRERRKEAENESVQEADVYIGRMSSSTRAGQKGSMEVEGLVLNEDVFRYGMLPGVREVGIVSPVTETDSTVNDSPFPDVGMVEGQVAQGTLKEILRDGGGRRATLRLVP
ncbi:hypothetical protein V5O48_008440 [Marasmius crinis-equi]|uniref:Protein kinase domain-containing protein n=1 Tax=Marasmius crinis-equi TaxID=585013 RepID=A0ABR3FEJ4_9AGAR